jgi:hypothetical protein
MVNKHLTKINLKKSLGSGNIPYVDMRAVH